MFLMKLIEELILDEAKELKETVLGLIHHNNNDTYEQLSFEDLEERLDSIIHRVSHL